MDLEKLAAQAAARGPEFRKISEKLKKCKPQEIDKQAQSLHDEGFALYDCLSCANCCRSLGPRITDRDIARIARHEKMKPAQFIDKYLRLDEDNDYVFREMPCPFLMDDNYCLIYAIRPKACSEFPHTDRKRFQQILSTTIKNTYICPIAYHVMEGLRVWIAKK